MSVDQVDDIEAAEDALSRAHMVVHQLVDALDGTTDVDKARSNAAHVLRQARQYCRPSCGWHGESHTYTRRDGEDVPDPDNDCGCPCHEQPTASSE